MVDAFREYKHFISCDLDQIVRVYVDRIKLNVCQEDTPSLVERKETKMFLVSATLLDHGDPIHSVPVE